MAPKPAGSTCKSVPIRPGCAGFWKPAPSPCRAQAAVRNRNSARLKTLFVFQCDQPVHFELVLPGVESVFLETPTLPEFAVCGNQSLAGARLTGVFGFVRCRHAIKNPPILAVVAPGRDCFCCGWHFLVRQPGSGVCSWGLGC